MKKTYIVTFGQSKRMYYTLYHAMQMVLALTLNGTECDWFECQVVNYNDLGASSRETGSPAALILL